MKYQHPPIEVKVVALRECGPATVLCDTPEQAQRYWSEHVATEQRHNEHVECMVVLFLNTRKRVMGHQVISTGTLDTILVHPREVFRSAIVANSAAIILMHNHPSGDPAPSEADIKVTRDLIRAGQLLEIKVLDHVIVGHKSINPKGYASLRELGYFYS